MKLATCPDCGRPITLLRSGWWTHEGLPDGCWRMSLDGPTIRNVAEEERQEMERPMLKEGERVFSHYVNKWGEIIEQGQRKPLVVDGKETSKFDTWHVVQWDDGSIDTMNDGDGNWNNARIIPPNIASRYGYGDDPKN